MSETPLLISCIEHAIQDLQRVNFFLKENREHSAWKKLTDAYFKINTVGTALNGEEWIGEHG